MKQGETKRLKPKDKHLSAWWKKRNLSRQEKQQAYKLMGEMEGGDPDAGARASEL